MIVGCMAHHLCLLIITHDSLFMNHFLMINYKNVNFQCSLLIVFFFLLIILHFLLFHVTQLLQSISCFIGGFDPKYKQQSIAILFFIMFMVLIFILCGHQVASNHHSGAMITCQQIPIIFFDQFMFMVSFCVGINDWVTLIIIMV